MMLPTPVTVFGGTGFVGRHIVQKLAENGVRIRVVSRTPERGLFLKPMGDVGQIVLMAGHVGNSESVAAAVDGAAAVINLVGILYERGRQRFAAVHAQGAERVAQAAHAAGAGQLIHVSAIGASAQSPSAYGRSKAAGEAAVRKAFADATIIRPSIVFGPDDAFFNRFAALARIAPALPLIDGGRTRFQPVYAGDLAAATARILDRPNLAGRVYELGGPRIYSFRDLMVLMLAEIRRQRWLIPVPAALAMVQAQLLELLPVPPLTRDQVRMLQSDNVVSDEETIGRFADLDIAPTPVETVIPSYLARYRRDGGRGG